MLHSYEWQDVVCKVIQLGDTILPVFFFFTGVALRRRSFGTQDRHKNDKLHKFFNVMQSEPEGPCRSCDRTSLNVTWTEQQQVSHHVMAGQCLSCEQHRI